ncbi:hypothetical protein JD844_018055 [Phrynosoma platyrhinos]|uniref:Amidase domain-containing protein n=1 Tax=Phrynosoma platyrhinos TaxID=52577 RepID=A0ABQ7SMV3_PHRPL|nr:hypothetical protein JD844_018055 [Phrynosoma platyrhinos]
MIQKRLEEILPRDGVNPQVVLAVTCGSAAAIVLWKWMARRGIQRKMEEARRWRDNSLELMERVIWKLKQKNPGVQSEFILSLSLVELAAKLKEESLSPDSVLYTYIKKALEVTQEVNCVTDFIHGCEEQLRELKKQKEKGLLYGVPVSIKDHIGCKSFISERPYLNRWLGAVSQQSGKGGQRNSEGSEEAGGNSIRENQCSPEHDKVILANLFFISHSYDCSNLIFGQTVNPFNHKKSPGGSSGGEGALIGGGGSILGFGTDVAGSIRLPSSFCGICGLKPTGSRLSTIGLASPIGGMKSVTATIGPMARDVDSLALCMKALLCDELFHLDPSVPPIPFKEEIYTSSKPLRIGYYEDDGYFQPSPSMRRAVRETKHLLQTAGHTLIPFVPPRLNYVVDELFTRGLFSDGAANLLEKFTLGLPEISMHCVELDSQKLYLQAYREEFIAEWRKLELDVILCPALGPAFNEGYPGKLFAATSYTNLYNVLNFPAGIVPVTTVSRADEEELVHYRGHYGDPWDKRLKEAVKDAVGLPVAVQCVALSWQDELCLRLMKEVETLVHERRTK